MSEKTTISWTDSTWNPVRGCSKVSAGCQHCYAMKFAARFSKPGQPYHGLAKMTPHGPEWTNEVKTVPDMLDAPLHWRAPRRIFVNSMSDLFHEQVPLEFVDEVFAIMALTPHHTYQILTKRPERMQAYLAPGSGIITAAGPQDRITLIAERTETIAPCEIRRRWPLPNVWLGVSAEDQPAADLRIPFLQETPAAVRFVSVEPMVGGVTLAEGWMQGDRRMDWVIIGGESGVGARYMDPAWAQRLVLQCSSAGIPVFFKQVGAVAARQWRYSNSKGSHPADWPEWMQVRQFPAVPSVFTEIESEYA